jgi:transcriptional regulator with XRE-family HTH domain
MAKRTRSARSVGPLDRAMGERLRVLRNEKRMSQAELGQKLGVSFQQVQKYEKGINRIGAARLQQIADVLEVSVTDFYSSGGKDKGQAEMQSLLFSDSKFSLRLLRAYSAVPDRALQKAFISLLERVAGIKSPEEEE